MVSPCTHRTSSRHQGSNTHARTHARTLHLTVASSTGHDGLNGRGRCCIQQRKLHGCNSDRTPAAQSFHTRAELAFTATESLCAVTLLPRPCSIAVNIFLLVVPSTSRCCSSAASCCIEATCVIASISLLTCDALRVQPHCINKTTAFLGFSRAAKKNRRFLIVPLVLVVRAVTILVVSPAGVVVSAARRRPGFPSQRPLPCSHRLTTVSRRRLSEFSGGWPLLMLGTYCLVLNPHLMNISCNI
jgi:hypothetical protein